MSDTRDFPPARITRSPSLRGIQALLATPSLQQGRFVGMKKSLRERLFGTRAVPAAEVIELKKEKTLAMINEPDPTAKPRARRTVGLTEARLRAANQQSWMTSGKGWSDFLGRFTRPSGS